MFIGTLGAGMYSKAGSYSNPSKIVCIFQFWVQAIFVTAGCRALRRGEHSAYCFSSAVISRIAWYGLAGA
eukprot:953467-Karenia_brevis.AAC.1